MIGRHSGTMALIPAPNILVIHAGNLCGSIGLNYGNESCFGVIAMLTWWCVFSSGWNWLHSFQWEPSWCHLPALHQLHGIKWIPCCHLGCGTDHPGLRLVSSPCACSSGQKWLKRCWKSSLFITYIQCKNWKINLEELSSSRIIAVIEAEYWSNSYSLH